MLRSLTPRSLANLGRAANVVFRDLGYLVALGAPLLNPALAWGAPIYLKPGQCIHIGAQEVCAMQQDQIMGSKSLHIQHLCRYGMHDGSEIPSVKNHALFQVMTTADGRKSETLLRQYGINDTDKEACQKEADRLNAKGG